jgi:hypothetical protein
MLRTFYMSYWRDLMTTRTINLQVGLRTITPQCYTNIGIPNDKYSDYHYRSLLTPYDVPKAYY